MMNFGQLMGTVRANAKHYCRVALLALFLLLSGQSAYALQQNEQQGGGITRAQAIQSARQQVDGRVLRVERTDRVYRIRMLEKSGRVVSVQVDRITGKVTHQSTEKKR